MTVTLPRGRAAVAAGCLVVAVLLVVGFAIRNGEGSGDGTLSGLTSTLHPYDVSVAQTRLHRAAVAGANESRLLTLTNVLLDMSADDPASHRRAVIDAAIRDLSARGCDPCLAALQRARR